MDPRKVRNGTKLILHDRGNNLDSYWNQFGILQVLQRSTTPQTSKWSGTIFCRFLHQTGTRSETCSIERHCIFLAPTLFLTEEILCSILAVSDKGVRPSSPRQVLSSVVRCVCALRKYFFRIGRKWEMNGLGALHCSTHYGPTSTPSTWPSERRLLALRF